MAELYSIKESTLTDIGDALRRKHGETEMAIVTEQQAVPKAEVFKSNNAVGFGEFNGDNLEINSSNKHEVTNVIKMPQAATIKIKGFYSDQFVNSFYILDEERTSVDLYADQASSLTPSYAHSTPIYDGNMIIGCQFELTVNSSVVTLYAYASTNNSKEGYYVECFGYDADGNPVETVMADVEVEREVKRTYKSSEMAAAIDAIGGIPEEAFVITGDCEYRFAYDGWNWFIDTYGDRITTKDIKYCQYMFYNAKNLEEIPFQINTINTSSNSTTSLRNMFTNCYSLKSVPKFSMCKISEDGSSFEYCYNIRYFPEDFADWFDWGYIDTLTSSYSGGRSRVFSSMYSLRTAPIEYLEHGNPVCSYSYSIYTNLFDSCSTLDEISDLPNPHYNATFTSNAFSSAFNACYRLKGLTFKMPDGVPYVVKWKGQTIDLSKYVGYVGTKARITNYNSGITADKEVTDDATYQALKDDPDWFTMNVAYSRYNHDSVVATINSLPDTSVYLATAGGTNTIKFKGESGSKTDGGAINTLTEEEIAVATAKGWTVTFA